MRRKDPWFKDALKAFFKTLEDRGTDTNACSASGISQRSMIRWKNAGRDLHERLEAAEDVESGEVVELTEGDLSERERWYLNFYRQYNLSRVKAQQSAIQKIAGVGFGGGTIVEKTTELVPIYDAAQEKIVHKEKVTIKEKEQGPNWQALAWLLERTDPNQFARKLFSISENDDDDMPVLDDIISAINQASPAVRSKNGRNGINPPSNGKKNGTADPE